MADPWGGAGGRAIASPLAAGFRQTAPVAVLTAALPQLVGADERSAGRQKMSFV